MNATVKIKGLDVAYNFSWYDIQQREGVYAIKGYPDHRIIVLTHATAGASVLYLGPTNITTASPVCWCNEKFHRTDEKLTVTLN